MKKGNSIFLRLAVLLFSAALISACSDDDAGNETPEVKQSPIKTIGVVYPDGVETYEFLYDANGRVTSINNGWTQTGEEPSEPDLISYDYSVANKLTITKGETETVYELDANGRAVKEIISDIESLSYEYDADGFLVKITETYEGTDYPKFDVTVANGNVTEHIRHNDPVRHKTFAFLSGDNVNGLHQTNPADSDWKVLGGLLGKPSQKMVNYLEYWDEGAEAEIKKTTMAYEFDDKDRITKWTRQLFDGNNEVYTYTYYEDAE